MTVAPSWCSTPSFGNHDDNPTTGRGAGRSDAPATPHRVDGRAGASHAIRNWTGAQPILPAELFLSAAGTNWGVAWLDPDPDLIVRRHWPFPSPGPYPSLPWIAAQLAGAPLSETPQKQWLRYYGQDGAWTRIELPVCAEETGELFPRPNRVHRRQPTKTRARWRRRTNLARPTRAGPVNPSVAWKSCSPLF